MKKTWTTIKEYWTDKIVRKKEVIYWPNFKTKRRSNKKISHEVSKTWSSALCSLLYSPTIPPYVQIFSTTCSQTPSICVLPIAWGTKFHTHIKRAAKITVRYTLFFKFPGRKRENKRLWTERKQAFPEFVVLLICSWNQLRFFFPKYVNFPTFSVPYHHTTASCN